MVKKAALIGFLLAAAFSSAGSKVAEPVFVGSGYAHGSFGSARNSADTRQQIGCYSTSGGGNRHISCSAADAAGTYRSCFSYDAVHVAAVDSLDADGYVYFSLNTSTGNCGYISINKSSTHAPRQP